mgnify:CR=1 FL=1
MKGRCFLIRFADDFVIGCESEARRPQDHGRACRSGLLALACTIHPTKTALIAFRKPEARQESADGSGTFDFLGLTHYWTKSRQGFWVIKRRTARKASASHQEVACGDGVAAIVTRPCNTSTRCSARSYAGISSTTVFGGTSACWRTSVAMRRRRGGTG